MFKENKKKLILNYIFFNNWNWEFYIYITPKFHSKGLSVSKQLNDKERLSIALENNFVRNVIKFSY